jgi:multidrug efflux pump subunit AcrA (membrane-fusion protein)
MSSARWPPANEATISAQVAGQLEKNLVDLGDRVKAGQETRAD